MLKHRPQPKPRPLTALDLDFTISHVFTKREALKRKLQTYDDTIEYLLRDRVERFGPMADPWPFGSEAALSALGEGKADGH